MIEVSEKGGNENWHSSSIAVVICIGLCILKIHLNKPPALALFTLRNLNSCHAHGPYICFHAASIYVVYLQIG